MRDGGFQHLPVLAEEAVTALAPRAGGIYVDCTLGGGGHAQLLLPRIQPGGVLIGIDRDEAALAAARRHLAAFADQIKLVRRNHAQLEEVLETLGYAGVDGVLFDLGTSSHQLDVGERGFSYWEDAPLDMRMDPAEGRSAADIVNQESVDELARILREYGEERWAQRIAGFIVRARQRQRIRTTGELVALVKAAIPAGARRRGPHPARRTFQALRIAVNDELGSLQKGLSAAARRLRTGGRVVAISFHSLEDRIVKHTLADLAKECACPPRLPVCRCGRKPMLTVITKRPVVPTQEEVARNPRARSAKLRSAERVLAAEGTT